MLELHLLPPYRLHQPPARTVKFFGRGMRVVRRVTPYVSSIINKRAILLNQDGSNPEEKPVSTLDLVNIRIVLILAENDLFQWLWDEGALRHCSSEEITKRILLTNAAAYHTTSMVYPALSIQSFPLITTHILELYTSAPGSGRCFR